MKEYNNFDLTDYNSYRLKAVCKKAYLPENDDDIRLLFKGGIDGKILLGSGNNVVLSKPYYDEEFVIFSGNYNQMELQSADTIFCQAGCSLEELSEFALTQQLSGLEMFLDIPSSLGGAVVMNAGAGGEDIKGILVEVYYYDPFKDAFATITKDEIAFEYRNSFFQKNPKMVVCHAVLQLKKADGAAIKEKMDTIKAARWAKQPREYANAGSVFKRPPGRFVGPMIDELGLKGHTVGGAQVSEKHSGFIINYNNATGADVLALIAYVRSKVKEKFGVDLEVEQRII